MFGPENNFTKMEELGIVPRSVYYMFDLLKNSSDILKFHVSISVVEVYREILRDLLEIHAKKRLEVLDSGGGVTFSLSLSFSVCIVRCELLFVYSQAMIGGSFCFFCFRRCKFV